MRTMANGKSRVWKAQEDRELENNNEKSDGFPSVDFRCSLDCIGDKFNFQVKDTTRRKISYPPAFDALQ